jgi:hypothetical protein
VARVRGARRLGRIRAVHRGVDPLGSGLPRRQAGLEDLQDDPACVGAIGGQRSRATAHVAHRRAQGLGNQLSAPARARVQRAGIWRQQEHVISRPEARQNRMPGLAVLARPTRGDRVEVRKQVARSHPAICQKLVHPDRAVSGGIRSMSADLLEIVGRRLLSVAVEERRARRCGCPVIANDLEARVCKDSERGGYDPCLRRAAQARVAQSGRRIPHPDPDERQSHRDPRRD